MCLVLLALTAVFNTVDHCILLAHLQNEVGISSSALERLLTTMLERTRNYDIVLKVQHRLPIMS